MKTYRRITILFLFITAGSQLVKSQNSILRENLDSLIHSYRATIGIGIIHIEKGDTLTINNSHPFPMQSVYKFPLAIAVLHEVDNNRFRLDQKFHVAKTDLPPNTWSPLREKYPEGEIDLMLYELLDYMVSRSDNNVCDFLFRLMGGTKPVEAYIRELGFRNIKIAATEDEMHQSWKSQYTNTTTPFEITRLLADIFQYKYLKPLNRESIIMLMINSFNSNNRIKGMLPEETQVAHKTGTSGSNVAGMTAAVNDIGIITLPRQNHIALSVLVSDSMESIETNEKIIAEIAKMVYDHYTH